MKFADWYREEAKPKIAGDRVLSEVWKGVRLRDIHWQLLNAYRQGGIDAAASALDELAQIVRAEHKK